MIVGENFVLYLLYVDFHAHRIFFSSLEYNVHIPVTKLYIFGHYAELFINFFTFSYITEIIDVFIK